MKRCYAVCAAAAASAAISLGARFAAQPLGFALRENAGVSFGLLASHPAAAALTRLAGLALMMCAALSEMLTLPSGVCLAAAAGGAASNALEQLFFGAVSDWMVLPFSDAVFEGGLAVNAADIAICAGTAAACAAELKIKN